MTTKEQINIVIAVLAVILLVLIAYSMMRGRTSGVQQEQFESEFRKVGTPIMLDGFDSEVAQPEAAQPEMEMEMEMEPEAAPVMPSQPAPSADVNVPFVDATTGTLISGPGFEKGRMLDTYGSPGTDIPSNYYFLDDGAGGEMSIQHNLCSKSCCVDQWPTPWKQKVDPYVCSARKRGELVGSNYFCSNTFQDAGCLCLSKKQGQFLYNRGKPVHSYHFCR